MDKSFIRRVTIRNYKSIAACKVDLHRLVFLVGPNGAGKSNFLDALRFTAESLRTSLDHALRERGTIREVRRRSGGHPNHFAIRLDLSLGSQWQAHYSFRVGAMQSGGYEVQNEECEIHSVQDLTRRDYFHVASGNVAGTSIDRPPASLSDRLYLVAASGLAAFRPVYDALSSIQVYNLNPREIAAMQKPDPGDLLRRDGSNASSVHQNLPDNVRERIHDYLSRIVPGISTAEPKTLGTQETVEFRQYVKGQDHPWRFLASSMSDGTLRAYGVLLAIFQGAVRRNGHTAAMTIGLEEPETALHPAAVAVLLAALRDASSNGQILVTSHSPDLLDTSDIPVEAILAVDHEEGQTRIGRIDSAGRELLKKQLFTPGELLKQNQLAVDKADSLEVNYVRQPDLFELGG